MSDHVYQMLELTGSSTESSDQAIRTALAHAAQTTKHLDWFEVLETRGEIKKGDVAVWQVTLKIGYRVEG
jgi:hypothetical protein